MARLVALEGPEPGREFPLEPGTSLIGRQYDAAVFLEALAVSRHHATIFQDADGCVVEDLGSSNGTYVNGQRIEGRCRLTELDKLQIGPYVLALQSDSPTAAPDSDDPIIRVSVTAQPSNHTLFTDNPAYKLQVVLEIAQHLARTPERSLLAKLLEQLLELFPQADRGLVVLCTDGDVERLRVAESAARPGAAQGSSSYSRTIVRRALEGGVGILSEDVPRDRQMLIQTVMSLKVRSLLCVPMISKDGRRLGVIHLDTTRPSATFRRDDLEVLTAVGMQAAVALDNAALHAELLRDERLRVEVGMARDIQRGFLPTDFPRGREGFELYACVEPALEVSGDLYDFFSLSNGRLAFYVGDVSGKGMPAALFMAAVHALFRHLILTETSPAATLARLDAALAADNPSDKYVTVALGLYDPPTGETTLAVAAHPPPLLRRVDGRVEEIAVRPGLPLGYGEITSRIAEHRVTLAPGETLILYTDGFSEARVPGGKAVFDRARLQEVLGGPRASLSLEACAEAARSAVGQFIGHSEQQDDLTMLLLRRKPES
jgi:serine phosphatase RsbU (regulator of sigma subunit)